MSDTVTPIVFGAIMVYVVIAIITYAVMDEHQHDAHVSLGVAVLRPIALVYVVDKGFVDYLKGDNNDRYLPSCPDVCMARSYQ